MRDMAKTGMAKTGKNQQQGYAFRGIDDVYNALASLLSQHNLVVLPRVLTREQTERQSAKGGIIFSVALHVEFDFVSSEDGSKHTVATFGEAMDSADKATNKAMSAAYKYACIQAFCIPTEGDNDADATTHEVAQIELVSASEIASIRQALVIIGKDENAALKYWKLTSMNDMPKSWAPQILEQLKPKSQNTFKE